MYAQFPFLNTNATSENNPLISETHFKNHLTFDKIFKVTLLYELIMQ